MPPVHLPENKNSKGMQIQTFDERPYKTNTLDSRHGLPEGGLPEGVQKKVSQCDQHGVSTIPGTHTMTAFQAKQCLGSIGT
eukprot:scaffold45966_cov46-Attheya_sp.AAC.4